MIYAFHLDAIVMVQVGLGKKVRCKIVEQYDNNGAPWYRVIPLPDGPPGAYPQTELSRPRRDKKISARDIALQTGHEYVVHFSFGIMILRYEGKDRSQIFGVMESFHPARRMHCPKPRRGQRVRISKSSIGFLYEHLQSETTQNIQQFPEVAKNA